MPSIESRIIDLNKALERRRMEQEAPIDPLSLSLTEFQIWVAGLDEQGKEELLEELNKPGEDGTMGLDLDMEDLERMIASTQIEAQKLRT